MKEYILTKRMYTYLKNRNLLACVRCSKSFILGDTVVSLRVRKTTWYHKKCYEETLN